MSTTTGQKKDVENVSAKTEKGDGLAEVNRTKRHAFAATFSFIFVMPFLFISVLELTSRKQGADYISTEISRIQARIVENQIAAKNLRDVKAEVGASLAAVQLTRDLQYQRELLHLFGNAKTLSIVGAESEQQTMGAIIRSTRELRKQANTLDQIALYEQENLQQIEVELAFLEKSISDTDRVISLVSNDLNSLPANGAPAPDSTLRAILQNLILYSNELGTIDTTNQTGRILQSFDISIVTLVRNVEQERREPTPDEIRSLIARGNTALEQLEEHQRKLRQRIFVLQKNIADSGIKPEAAAETGQNAETPTLVSGTGGANNRENSWSQAMCLGPDFQYGVFPLWTHSPPTCWLIPFFFMSSGMLFSTAVVSGGAIGALFVGCYFGTKDAISRMFLGAIAGLVALLILKGGKFLFIVDVGSTATDNPYAGAFAGILAGLFTDKGFKLIEHLVDQRVDQFKNGGASDGSGVNGDSQNEPQEDKDGPPEGSGDKEPQPA